MTTLALTPVRVRERLLREEDDHVREREQTQGAASERPGGHVSVMREEVLEQLSPSGEEMMVDATAGEGGHSFDMLKRAPHSRLLALDADPRSVELSRERLAPFGERAEVVEANFGDLAHVLKHRGISSIHKVLFDLGWNSGQLTLGRGFSFLSDEPLNMSYGKKPASGFTAAEALNQWDEETLANVLFGYGEERYARRIARAVIERREEEPIKTTLEFVEIIRDSTPRTYHSGRIHFATRSFQALRMAVNDELGVLDRGVRAAWEHLAPGGRIVVISFHSIEDRAVKRLFAEFSKHGGRLLAKKPLTPSRTEISGNPRARSAKLRAIEKAA